jgi:serine/threonine-protein kinase
MLGRRLRHYSVEEELGRGGMGVVYRAIDTRLGRSVAIKVVRGELLEKGEELQRFEREARLLATLNHPNVAAIHGLEEHEGIRFLVLEYVPGRTLAERFQRGNLPVKEALALCKQIAEALEAAHGKGIVHRDLKPANVKIADDGRVKVLDFGLAKAIRGDQPAAEASQALTHALEATERGVILGTTAYMSPEQASGKPVDTRTDIWAFGCVLYEALAGRRPFAGATVTELLAAVIEREPDWGALPSETPPSVRRLLAKCLEKDPQHRLRDAGDARIELEDTLAGRHPADAPAAPRRRGSAWAAAAAGLAFGAAASWTVVRSSESEQAEPAVARFAVPLLEEPYAWDWAPLTAISPDGTQIVYGFDPLMLRSVDRLEAQPIEGTEECGYPFFSPDGQWLGYMDYKKESTLKKLPLAGGAPITIAEGVDHFGATWGADDTIVYAWMDLYRVPAAGGNPDLLLKLDHAQGERYYRDPVFLPGGRAVVFTISTDDIDSHDDARIGLLELATGTKRILVEGGMGARYSPSGHLVYARKSALHAVSFDLERLEVTGHPFPVLEGVLMSANSGIAEYAISRDGTLVYAPGPEEDSERTLVWVDRRGEAEPLPLPPRSYLHPRLSPDGQQLAVEVEGPTHNLFTYDFARGTFTKMSFDGLSHWPFWTPRGDRLTFRSMRTGIMSMWWMPADRSGPEERLTEIGDWQTGASWSADGTALAFTTGDDPETGPDVYVLPLDGDHRPREFAKSRFREAAPRFSPDGRWIAYVSNESGRPEVYVQPWPGPGPKIQISTEGGRDAQWSRQSGELFYRNGDRMMACPIRTAGGLSAGKPAVLWEGHYLYGLDSSCCGPGLGSTNYDVTADGERFLMIEDKDQDAVASQLNVVLNWSLEIEGAAEAQAR